MDTYFPKTRRPIATLSTLKRPPPSITPPKASKIPNTPTTPKDARLPRPRVPPPIKSKLQQVLARRQPEVKEKRKPISIRELFESVHQQEDESPIQKDDDHSKTKKSDNLPICTPLNIPKPATASSVSPSKISNGPLKGVSTSLLDMIRTKEAAAKAIQPELERKRELLGIAPSVVRIVSTVFTSSKRDILSYDKIIEKCHKSLNSTYTTPTIIECLNLMDKIAPEWISTVEISRGKFMRFNKTYTIPQLQKAIKSYKETIGDNHKKLF